MKKLLFLILIIGAFSRFYNINWDQNCCQHPDERAIVMFTLPLSLPKNIDEFLKPESPLNPHFFAYGNLPLYFLKGASIIAGSISPDYLTYAKINLVGRFISVLADLGTIFLIYKIGSILFKRAVGLASSFVYALSVLPIQSSHFFTVDVILTFFVTLTIYKLIKFYRNPTLLSASLVGIAFGLALSTKISAIPLLAAISLAIFVDFFLIFIAAPHKFKSWFPHIPNLVKRLATHGFIILFFTFLTFIISEPYALIDYKEFIRQSLLQSQMTYNPYIFPYTLQYVGKIPFIYELKNLFFWGLGPFVFVFSIAGLAKLISNLKSFSNTKRAKLLIILTFFFLYFIIVGKFAVGWMRYMLPLYPLFSIFAAVFAYRFLRLVKLKLGYWYLLVALVFIGSILVWPLSFMSIYANENTRITASKWINGHIPQGSSIAIEHWDDRLPMQTSNAYNFIELTLYDQPDDESKWSTINGKIKSADYIIIASNRLYVPLQKLSDCQQYKVCFPQASKYYKQLFSGELGFKKVAEFSSYPTIPFSNFRIIDDSADESFTVYDHPKVIVFKKTQL